MVPFVRRQRAPSYKSRRAEQIRVCVRIRPLNEVPAAENSLARIGSSGVRK